MAVEPSLIGGALGMIGNFFNSYMNYRSVENTNIDNRQSVARQNQMNLDQWQRENVYNNPVNQIQRLRAAGLNPGILYGSGGVVNSSAPSPAMQSSRDVPPQSTFQVDPLTAAQIANINADTQQKNAQTKYQQYMNDIEEQLAHLPVGTVVRRDENGEDVVDVEYGNARVRMAYSEMRQLGLTENALQFQLNDLFYDLAVKFGDYSFNGSVADQHPMNTPNFEKASNALRGDYDVRILAARIEDIALKAAQAENAGREAYGKWLKENADNPFVKFALALQGFFQTSGITLPSISVTNSPKGRAVKWLFGK